MKCVLRDVCPCLDQQPRQKFYRNDFTSANPQFHSNQIYYFDVETTNNKSVRYNLVLIGFLFLQIKSVLNKTVTFIIFPKSVNVRNASHHLKYTPIQRFTQHNLFFHFFPNSLDFA